MSTIIYREVSYKNKERKRNFDFPKNFRFWYYYGDDFEVFFLDRLECVADEDELLMLMLTVRDHKDKATDNVFKALDNFINRYNAKNQRVGDVLKQLK